MIGYETEHVDQHPDNLHELTQIETSVASINKALKQTIHQQVPCSKRRQALMRGREMTRWTRRRTATWPST